MYGERRVTEIPAIYRPNMQEIAKKEVVCAYARVSTENEEQEDSFERQCEHFTEVIKQHKEWEFGGIYADWGISGTKADSRKNFLRMIEDCRAGKINRILVKSVSRFARNTVDTLQYIRELKELGVGIFFEIQNIYTLDPGGEVLLTILAAMAEQESRDMSTNIKWAFQKRFKDGKVLINFRATLGYAKAPDGEGYVIVEDEAELVRRIYREFLAGNSLYNIVEEFKAEGLKTKLGREWRVSTLQSILTNEKYTGNAILGKTFKPDVLSKSRKKNNGQAPQYYVENSHPAIISQAMFDAVQHEIQIRNSLRSMSKTGKGKYSRTTALSGLLVCGDCGSNFRRYKRTLASGEKVAAWLCKKHQADSSACSMLPLKETEIMDAYRGAVRQLVDMRAVLETIQQGIEQELPAGDRGEIRALEEEIVEKQQAILALFKERKDGKTTNSEYEKRYQELSAQIIQMQEKLKVLKDKQLTVDLAREKAVEAIRILQDGEVDIDNPNIMRSLLDCVKVISKHELEFQFKCGVVIKQTL